MEKKIMRNGSAYLSTIIYTTKKLAKLAKSLRHSLRVEIDGESSISYKREKENLNKILFNGKSEDFLQNLNEMTQETYLDYIDTVIKTNQNKEIGKLKPVKLSKSDSNKRYKSLKYLREKIEDKEFHELLEKFANEPHRVNRNNLIVYFETLNTKKTIRNNLDKYIEVIEKVGKAQERREAKLSVDKVEFVEFVVKIPFENNIDDISSEDMLLYSQDFFRRHFKNYDIVVGVSHNDELHMSKKPENIEKWEKEHNQKYEQKESGYHSHLFINTKNKETGEFDYYIQQHLLVVEYLKSKGFSDEIIKKDVGYIDEKGVRKQTLTQIKNQGKNLQEFIYEDINKHLFHKKNYNAVLGFNDFTITQKQEIEKNKRLSINNRQFNGRSLDIELEKQRKQELIEEIEQLEEQEIDK
ncbi:hypothetical protein [Sulfurimonas sp. NWX367]|uniref:hypothetical protein n=1 Tax=Sulfurimonas sp. NWX367 TaxID=2925413 RepID=UPI003204AB4F